MAFIATTGEEKGLLGSLYYADHPTFTPGNMVANINMDGLSIYGPARDLTIIGYGKSEMDIYHQQVASSQSRYAQLKFRIPSLETYLT